MIRLDGFPERVGVILLVSLALTSRLNGQEAPPPIPWFVVDLHANIPRFPDNPQLAASRLLNEAELPAAGLGGDVGVHLYPFTWRQLTFGVGGQLTWSRAHNTPDTSSASGAPLRPVTERFVSLAPQLSFNFGTGNGWSYLSGGVSAATWSTVPDGLDPLPPDLERLRTINYGGGARWFIKSHLAFSLDVRFYAISPSTPTGGLPNGPRTTLMVIGAGLSLK
jgi:hypothetical protein